MLGKIELFILSRSLQGHLREDIPPDVFDKALTSACDVLSVYNEILRDEMFANYLWYSSGFTQYHLLTWILSQLCIKPTHTQADNAWAVVDHAIYLVQRNPLLTKHNPRWVILDKLREKAHRCRVGHENEWQCCVC
jgi:hypothetical protein